MGEDRQHQALDVVRDTVGALFVKASACAARKSASVPRGLTPRSSSSVFSRRSHNPHQVVYERIVKRDWADLLLPFKEYHR